MHWLNRRHNSFFVYLDHLSTTIIMHKRFFYWATYSHMCLSLISFLQRFYFRAGFGFVQDPSNVRNVCTQWKLYFEIYILSPFNLSCILYKKVKTYFFFLEILKSLEKRNIYHDNDKSWLHTWHPHCNLCRIVMHR